MFWDDFLVLTQISHYGTMWGEKRHDFGSGSFEIQNENTNRVKSLIVKDSGMRVEEEKREAKRTEVLQCLLCCLGFIE